MVQVKVIVRGKVQGIGFRYFVSEHAKQFGLKGYVRNLSDGSVESVFDGERHKIDDILNVIKTEHPTARVKNIEISLLKSYEIFDGFKLKN